MADAPRSRGPRGRAPQKRRRAPPPEATGRERAWLEERLVDERPVSLRLADGERLEGRLVAFDGEVMVVEPPGSQPIQVRKRDVRYIVGFDPD